MPNRDQEPGYGWVEHTYAFMSCAFIVPDGSCATLDIKATALLKLIYLEMYGHDMSWASFHILEVMSSVKHAQKRVGYLGAVQSLRSDTEVLMLATNLLKKVGEDEDLFEEDSDLSSAVPTTLSLPLVTLPHVINPSLVMALLTDLLPRLSHSQAAIRKKTIVTLYRFALVYPEALRPAWSKIKERLMDDKEDPSVTAAIVNVVCELGWRRPQDFLPLAPRLFDLLVEGGNNWMAIKIVKLFATLTPLEPRLVRKLLPPLTSLIRTTPAMSLLYECINGIIQGGILESTDETAEGEEIAKLCVGKLRGMIAIEGDPNLKYVALLAFQKIVPSHPHLVSLHQDVILGCIDDADISIRLRALELLVNMVDSTNLAAVVARLMRQLRSSPIASNVEDPSNDRGLQAGVIPAAESDDEAQEESLRPAERRADQPPPLTEDYRVVVIRRILEMCSRETYVNVSDFPWYIDILVQLVSLTPIPTVAGMFDETFEAEDIAREADVTPEIGLELLNIAVRVKDVRLEATRAAETLVLERGERSMTSSGNDRRGYLHSAVWIIGEYASYLGRPSEVLTSLLHSSAASLPSETLKVLIQAIPKVFTSISGTNQNRWDSERKTMTSLLIARIVHFLDGLTSHPNLEVQERSVAFVELMRLAADAVSAQPTSEEPSDTHEAPPLLTQVIPSLFAGLELNPVAPQAQKRVPVPEGIDLETPINSALPALLQTSVLPSEQDGDIDESSRFYYQRPRTQTTVEVNEPAAKRLDQASKEIPSSYQQEDSADNAAAAATLMSRRKAERRERNKDDPFYIPTSTTETDSPSSGTPIQNIIRHANGDEVDIDSIPIMDLDLNNSTSQDNNNNNNNKNMGSLDSSSSENKPAGPRAGGRYHPKRKPVEIAGDETISTFADADSFAADNKAGSAASYDVEAHHRHRAAATAAAARPTTTTSTRSKPKKSLLQVDSSGIGTLSLDEEVETHRHPFGGGSASGRGRRGQQEEEDEEMARALKEVERVRLEMQRASERIQVAEGVPPEGTLIKKKLPKKKKKKMKVKSASSPTEEGSNGKSSMKVKKKKKKTTELDRVVGASDVVGQTTPQTEDFTSAANALRGGERANG
ncbi:MAG: AP-3 complex subunit delta [Peltula sp. TS41687]|nr:MAG: AP-3 complex subunit delta [Peltula sp. TS41687]